jgi:hypothetical protein
MTAIVCALSACGAPGDQPPETAAGKTTIGLHADRVKEYQSLEELKRDSTVVVRATAGDATVESLNGIPVTITTVKVSDTRWGKLTSKTLSVLQVGDDSVLSDDFAQVLKKGAEYIMFLKPYHLVPGDSTGRYIVTGDQGVYALDGQGGNYRFAGGGEPQLPASIPHGVANGSRFLAD